MHSIDAVSDDHLTRIATGKNTDTAAVWYCRRQRARHICPSAVITGPAAPLYSGNGFEPVI